MNLSDKLSNVKNKLSSDARTAERGANSKLSKLKRGARQDVRTAERRARQVDSKDVRKALRKAGSQFEGVEGAAAGQGDEETFARAEDNAQMGAPLEATLDPTTSPQDMQNFVTGSAGSTNRQGFDGGVGVGVGAVDQMVSSGANQDRDVEDDLFAFGSSRDRDADDGNPLEFDTFGDGDSDVLAVDDDGRWL